MPHLELTYTGASPGPLVATGAFEAVFFLDLYTTGESRGDDLPVGDSDGRDPFDRSRDYLAATVKWEITGKTDINGSAPSGTEVAQLRKNVRALTRWFDDAPGKRFTVAVVEDDATREEAGAAHSKWGNWRWHGQLVKVNQLIYVADGILTAVP